MEPLGPCVLTDSAAMANLPFSLMSKIQKSGLRSPKSSKITSPVAPPEMKTPFLQNYFM